MVTYTVRVPSEGKVATTVVELQIPEDVTVLSVEGPADRIGHLDDRHSAG